MDARNGRTVAQTNRLASEQSPYLLQHAHNPVDWYPWGEEALKTAEQLDRPILLSVGYSACHWCHVMERESFEDLSIADIMNRHYVSIKVDREERPDIDALYQPVAQALTGGGGWPLTVFLTPKLSPLFCGTYYPPRARYGRPGFADVLQKVASIYRDDPDRVTELTSSLSAAMVSDRADLVGHTEAIDIAGTSASLVDAGARVLLGYLDSQWGGLGRAPKFPNTTALELMLRASLGGLESCEKAVTSTLRHMIQGGIYDQLGGGFHRYSTDRQWLIPHFEKMLYDNALIPLALLGAFQATGDESFAVATRETLEYLLRDMRHPEGGIYSSEDADSEGEEGRFYVWTPSQVRDALGPDDAELAIKRFGISAEGSFEGGASVLTSAEGSAVTSRMKNIREALLREREKRVRPFRDEKILAGWNGLALSAFSKAGRILDCSRFTEAARDIATFLDTYLYNHEKGLMRAFKERTASVVGFLEDYAFVARGLVDLYEATFDTSYLQRARTMVRAAAHRFWDEDRQILYDVAFDAAQELPARPWGYADDSVPSAAAVLAETIIRLGPILQPDADRSILELPERILSRSLREVEANPWAYASMLSVLGMAGRGLSEVTLVPGDEGGLESLRELLRAVSSVYNPDLALYGPLGDAGFDGQGFVSRKAIDGISTAYVCRGFSCQPPVTEPETLKALLSQTSY